MIKFALSLGGLAAGAAASVLRGQKLTGGNGTLYIGGRPDRIVIFDEATEKAIGEIKIETGAPYRLTISRGPQALLHHQHRVGNVEIADIALAQIIDTFRLSEGNKKVRIRGFQADPRNRYVILLTKTATKMVDHWEIGPMTILQYDMQEHKVMRTMPWPDGEEREFAGFKFSPDGKFLYLFGEDIIVFDTDGLQGGRQVGAVAAASRTASAASISASLDDTYEEPGFFTGIFTVQDAVQHRQIMGIARVNLQAEERGLLRAGPAERRQLLHGARRELAYGLHEEVGRCEFWSFDLEEPQA